MNAMLRATLASAIVGGVTLLAGVESADAAHSVFQATTPEQHDHGTTGNVPGRGHATARESGDMMARLAAMDARIERLVADMNSFAGEMKVAAMAELLTALVERQSLMQQEMMTMHGDMRAHGKDAMMSPAAPDGDGEPGVMCAPAEQP